MRELTIYKSDDGKTFNSAEEAIKYDQIVAKINQIMQNLESIPNDCSFINGEGYIQQDPVIVSICKEELLTLGRSRYKKPDLSFSWMGRYADDSNDIALYHAWGRLSNIDYKSREWGQGYYAINPTEGKQEPFKSKK